MADIVDNADGTHTIKGGFSTEKDVNFLESIVRKIFRSSTKEELSSNKNTTKTIVAKTKRKFSKSKVK